MLLNAFLKDLGNLCINQRKFIYGFRIFWLIYLVSRILSLRPRSWTRAPRGAAACPSVSLGCMFVLVCPETLARRKETFIIIPNRIFPFLMTHSSEV